MNKRIKFRIWDKRYKQWLENSSSLHCSSNWQIDAFTGRVCDFVESLSGEIETFARTCYSDDDYVIQQFTGLKDSKGKDIYEGDILQFHKGQPYQSEYEVYWNYCGFSLISAKRASDKYGVFTKNLENLCPADKPVIIGNIFENPELLK